MSNHVESNGANGTLKYFNLKDMPHIIKDIINYSFRDQRPKINSDILEVVGNTPLVKLNKIPKEEGIQCEMYAKCEYLNPGGSVKDRIAYRMFLDAEQRGILKPGKSVIIEPTSGNTGIGLALAAAVKGYRCIIVIPDKMSDEKVNTLRALGAEIIRTPAEAPSSSPESNIGVAKQLEKEIPGAVVLDQYNNPYNPLAHYDGTAEEILWSFDDKIDMVVLGAGTSGSVSGVGHKIKERNPNCIVVGVDPYGSILAEPEEINESNVTFYEVEGLGYDFLPQVLDRSVVHKWIKTNDADSLKMARRLIIEEGLLCGMSSGSAMWAACKAAKTLKYGQKCVVVLPDSIRNYMTKFISDQWMEARNFKSIESNPNLWWWEKEVSESIVQPTPSISISSSASEAFAKLQHSKAPLLTVEDDKGSVVGVVTADAARRRLTQGGAAQDPLAKFAAKKFYSVDLSATPPPTLGRVSRLLDISSYVVVFKTDSSNQRRAVGAITSEDLLMFIHSGMKKHVNGN